MKKIIFITIHIIDLFVIMFFLIFIPYGFIYALMISNPLLIVDLIKYQHHVQRYPLNDLKEYQFDIKHDNFAVYDEKSNCYYIKIFKSNYIYKTIECEKQLTFNMKNCLFSKNFIRAYFIRNIHFIIIKKKKLPIRKISESLKVSDDFKYKNLKIIFLDDKKEKEYWLVKDGKTKINLIVADIMGNPLPMGMLMYRHKTSSDDYKILTEKYYANCKR